MTQAPAQHDAARPARRRPYAGQSMEQRRQTRRETLIEAGLDVLAEVGLTGVGVRAICARSGLTARYFYESFATVDDLLIALCQQVGEEVASAGLLGLQQAPADLASRVRGCVTGGFDVVLADPRKACVVAVGAGHAGMNATRQRMLLDYADLVVEQFQVIAPAGARPMTRAQAFFLVGGAVELVTAQITGQMQLGREELIEETTRVFLAAMGE